MLHAYNRDTCNWGVLLSDAKYKSCSVLEASSDRKLLAVGSICGNLTVIDAGELPGFFLRNLQVIIMPLNSQMNSEKFVLTITIESI